MKITLTRVKVNARLSEETACFSADVLVDGVPVAEALNHGHGGPNIYRVRDQDRWRALEAHVAALPPWTSRWTPKPMPMDVDMLLAELLDRHEVRRKLARACKTKTLFRLVGDAESDDKEVWRTINRPWGPEVEAHLAAKYPGRVEAVANRDLDLT